jgi:hypothetical protein
LPSGEIQFIHPKDGVFRKVNEGRVAVGNVILDWENPNPLLLNLLGQVPLIRKVKIFFEFTSPRKKLQRKKKKKK